MGERKKESDRKKFLDALWSETKKLNWQVINQETRKKFTIGIMANKNNVEIIKDWLLSFDYKLGKIYEVKSKTKSVKGALERHLVIIPDDSISKNLSLLKSVTFCIADEESSSHCRNQGIKTYVFPKGKNRDELIDEILANHTDLRFALSYNFPVFRCKHADIETNETAIQNTGWVVMTAVPNVIPGPHQAVSAPIEAIADFTVLTINEAKLMFELTGLSGYKVNPRKNMAEIMILLGFAKAAETAATNLSGKAPSGMGVIIKGTIAYAFTYAIGEALFFYLNTGQQVGKEFFQERVEIHKKTGKKYAQKIYEPFLKKRKKIHKKL